jgi:hypothetical protein
VHCESAALLQVVGLTHSVIGEQAAQADGPLGNAESSSQ